MAYKLTYFDLRGRAEPARLVFALAGQEYEDVRIKREEWPALKQTLTWGQIPVLQVGDKTIAQSGTIIRFLGRRFNLAGSNDFEMAKCEELADAMTDVQTEWSKAIFFEKDETKKAAALKTLKEESLPKYLGTFNKIQGENGGNFLVGKSATWADVWVANALEQFEGTFGAELLDKYPNLKKMKTALFAIPSVKAYVDKRPA